MCRFLAYKGRPIIVDELLYKPENSLINQSYNAKEMEEPLNGDGFGIGWYVPEISRDPALFSSIQPAWNNRNMRYLAPKISSRCIFAHVRAASVGDVTQLNCHPFHYRNYLMMHNGGIEHFEEIKRPLIDKLSEERFRWIQGQTDSEHIFALFLDHLLDNRDNPQPSDFITAFTKTFDDIGELKNQYGLTDSSYLNLVITDGEIIIGSRYVTDSNEVPLSMHHSEKVRYECKNGVCHIHLDAEPHEKAILIASEKLTEDDQHWYDIPPNHFVSVNADLKIQFTSI